MTWLCKLLLASTEARPSCMIETNELNSIRFKNLMDIIFVFVVVAGGPDVSHSLTFEGEAVRLQH
jgi:hypothetical protein